MRKRGLKQFAILLSFVLLILSACSASENNSVESTPKSSKATGNSQTIKPETKSPVKETPAPTKENKKTDTKEEDIITDIIKCKDLILNAPGTEEYLSDEEITSRFDKIINEAKEKKIDREVIYHRIRNIISELHCVHLGIYTKPSDPIYEKGILNIGFYWFGDELRIAQCTEENKKYLGCEVTKIAGKSVDEVVKLFATIRSYETDSGEKAALEGRFYETDLTYLGLLSKDGVDITVKDKNGKETSIVGKMGAGNEKMISISSLISPKKQASILVRNMSKSVNYCYEGDPDHKTMYFLYRSCDNMEDYTLAQCFDDMMKELNANPKYTNLVLDVRLNGGGNRYLMLSCLLKYKAKLGNKQISIITGKNTYSSAFQLIADCFQNFDHVKLYGEKTGQAVHHYTEVNQYSLNVLNCNLVVPTVKNNDPELEERYGDLHDGITPDVEVDATYEDYLNGKDTVYEKIISDLK